MRAGDGGLGGGDARACDAIVEARDDLARADASPSSTSIATMRPLRFERERDGIAHGLDAAGRDERPPGRVIAGAAARTPIASRDRTRARRRRRAGERRAGCYAAWTWWWLLSNRSLDDAAVFDADDAVGEALEARIVGDDDDGAAVVVASSRSSSITDERGLGVERGGRLVADDDRRVAAERARDRDALLLTAREIGGQVVHRGAEADELEQAARFAARILRASDLFIWIAIATFSSAVSAGNRLKPWNTKPKLRARSAGQVALGRGRRRRGPRARPRRAVGLSSRPRIEISVVLPEPDGPSIRVTSPGRMSSVASASAATAVSPVP